MVNGYNRIDYIKHDFNVLAVSLQTVLGNWLGPVWRCPASPRLLLAWLEAINGQTALFSRAKQAVLTLPSMVSS